MPWLCMCGDGDDVSCCCEMHKAHVIIHSKCIKMTKHSPSRKHYNNHSNRLCWSFIKKCQQNYANIFIHNAKHKTWTFIKHYFERKLIIKFIFFIKISPWFRLWYSNQFTITLTNIIFNPIVYFHIKQNWKNENVYNGKKCDVCRKEWQFYHYRAYQ